MRQPFSLLAAVTLVCVAAPAMPQGGPADSSRPETVFLPLLTPSEMKAADAEAVNGRAADIARSAQIYGYSLDTSYSYRQAVCTVAPGAVLLMYESVGPGEGLSRFSAVVYRSSAQPPVDIVPILNGGAVPFLPAWKSPHSIAVFNRMSSGGKEASPQSDRWPKGPVMESALCYLALIGEPGGALLGPALVPATIRAPEPTLSSLRDGGTAATLSVRANADQYQIWTLEFSRTGALVRSSREVHTIDAVRETARVPSPSVAPAAPSLASSDNPQTSAPSVASRIATEPVATVPGPESPAVVQSASQPAVAAVSQPAPTAHQAAPVEAPSASLPMPARRFVPDPPPPPGRFIPDAKTPGQIP